MLLLEEKTHVLLLLEKYLGLILSTRLGLTAAY